ncbi:MAG: hypothetical protein ACRD12_15535 [Acidimicrobiales bacterium]
MSVGIAVAGVAGFGAYGFGHDEPSTLAYLFSVTALGVVVALVRREPLPDWLALTLAGLALGHLAGGLVTVGDAVLYNLHPGLPVFQYDHVVHAGASGVAAVVVWGYLAPRLDSIVAVIIVSFLGALGVGAINELIEFLATLAHRGGNVGGYFNTGWDLVSNTIGAVLAIVVLVLRHRS